MLTAIARNGDRAHLVSIAGVTQRNDPAGLERERSAGVVVSVPNRCARPSRLTDAHNHAIGASRDLSELGLEPELGSRLRQANSWEEVAPRGEQSPIILDL